MPEVTEITRRKLNPVEYKALAPTDLSVDENSRTISGYAAIFGNKDDANDIIIKGAFAKSINERGPDSTTNRKIAFLWQHDMEEPLGRITVLKEDTKGLYFEAVLDKIPEADRAIEQLKSGTLNQFSFGYSYVWDKMEYDEEQDAFILYEVKLYEISVVTLACNEETMFCGMKASELESEENKLRRETEKTLKRFSQEDEYAIRQLIKKHLALNSVKPPQALKNEDEPQFNIESAIKNVNIF